MVRGREVEKNAGFSFDFSVLMKFSSIIGRDGFESAWKPIDKRYRSFIERRCGSVFEFFDEHKSCFSLVQGDDAIIGAVPHNGIDFPVTFCVTGFNTFRSFGDMSLIAHPASTIIGPIAFAALFRGLTKIFPEVSPVDLILPNVLIDGLMADSSQHKAKSADVTYDLLW